MAKFFNQKVKKGRKKQKVNTSKTVVIGIIIVLLIIFIGVLFSVFKNNEHKDAIIKIRDKVAAEINETITDKTLFFTELKNVKDKDITIDYSDVDFTKLGSYDVTIKVFNKKYASSVEVIDTESPIIVVKDVTIAKNNTYSAEDFIKECKDNSKQACIIEFYEDATSESGEKIDYANYKNEGTYIVEIIAKDEYGNKTTPQKATLIIGSGKKQTPTTCQYGDNSYNESEYILSVDATTNGCARDLNLYKNEAMIKPVNELIQKEKEKLKKEFSKINLGVKNIHVDSNIITILNTKGDGFVGYSIKITVSINDSDVIEEYYLNKNGGREYIINKYL